MQLTVVTLFLAVIFAAPAAGQQVETCPKDECCPMECCRQVKDCPPKDECCPIEALTPDVCQRFCGQLSFQSSQRSVQASVVVRQWHIANQQTEEIPHQGLVIVHVCAGTLSTETGGKPMEWVEGTFWTVPAGQRLIVYTERESVVLQTVDFIPHPSEEIGSDLPSPDRPDS